MAKRLAGRFGYPADDPFRPATTHNTKPPSSKKPMMVFVCSMGDLFHEAVDFQSVEFVLDDISKADPDLKHRWLFLTKRPERMLKFTQWMAGGDHISTAEWPRNCWLGVTAENQEQADKRIPILLKIPAAVRFLSYEPALGPVDADRYLGKMRLWNQDQIAYAALAHEYPNCEIPALDWVICGTESGHKRRPAKLDWIRGLRNQCSAAGVPFFCKQAEIDGRVIKMPEIDGRVWGEYPEVVLNETPN
jgi:protein gp37